LIGAIALKGIVASINLLGATDGLTFEAFVIQKLVPNLWEEATVFGIIALFIKEKQLKKPSLKLGQN
jgi:hypothetical protein